jgi:hypothetical protein
MQGLHDFLFLHNLDALVFGEYIKSCLMNLMLDFSFLRAKRSVKEHVLYFKLAVK